MTKKKKEKTAQNKGQWITYVVYMLLGAACGIFDLMYMDTAGQSEKGFFSEIIPLALMLIGIYAAMLIQIIIHEAGHLIFGLMTGYRFSSFRVANLMWVKLDGRIRCRKLHIAGTGGQCLMIPPDLKDGKMPVMLYNFGGAIINLATAVLCVGLSFLCSARSLGWTILMIFAVIGLAFALINGLPIKMGSVNNDGRNALELSRSEEATRAFWIQMKVNEQIAKGLRLKDMPDEWFKVPSDELMKNGIVATTGVLVCNRLMDQQRFDEAEKDMKRKRREVGQARKRIAELDQIFKRIYEDDINGTISHERFLKLSAEYEAEQRELTEKVNAEQKEVDTYEQNKSDFDSFAAIIRKYVGITELTPTIVNEFVKKIVVHAPEKIDGKRFQKVDIVFNFVGEIHLPTDSQTEQKEANKHKKTA